MVAGWMLTLRFGGTNHVIGRGIGYRLKSAPD